MGPGLPQWNDHQCQQRILSPLKRHKASGASRVAEMVDSIEKQYARSEQLSSRCEEEPLSHHVIPFHGLASNDPFFGAPFAVPSNSRGDESETEGSSPDEEGRRTSQQSKCS